VRPQKKREDGLVRSHVLLEAQQGIILARLSFVDFPLKWGGQVIFYLDLGIPNCGT
jgi:hypothetical protein